MFDEQLLGAELRRTRLSGGDGVAFDVRLPWYRSLPLAQIESIEVKIDGGAIDTRDATLGFFGVRHRIADLLRLSDVYWFVLDAAELSVTTSEPLASGSHDVEIGITLVLGIPASARSTTGRFVQYAHHSRVMSLGEEGL